MQTDDPLKVCNVKFIKVKSENSKRFKSKPASLLEVNGNLRFCGITINRFEKSLCEFNFVYFHHINKRISLCKFILLFCWVLWTGNPLDMMFIVFFS